LPFLLSLLAFRFFGLDEDEDKNDFDWAGVCDEDAMGWVLLFSEEGCFGLSVQARAVFEDAHLLWLILAWRSQYCWLRTCTWCWSRLPNPAELVLELIWEPVIELLVERFVVPAGAWRVLVEVESIFDGLARVPVSQVLGVDSGVVDGVTWAEKTAEFINEHL